MAGCQALGKPGLRRRAFRVKPAADVNLRVGFTTVMPGPGRVGGFRVPSVYGEIGIPTPNHEPADRIRRYQSAHFTSEFL